jgi:hypothetical protein
MNKILINLVERLGFNHDEALSLGNTHDPIAGQVA